MKNWQNIAWNALIIIYFMYTVHRWCWPARGSFSGKPLYGSVYTYKYCIIYLYQNLNIWWEMTSRFFPKNNIAKTYLPVPKNNKKNVYPSKTKWCITQVGCIQRNRMAATSPYHVPTYNIILTRTFALKLKRYQK